MRSSATRRPVGTALPGQFMLRSQVEVAGVRIGHGTVTSQGTMFFIRRIPYRSEVESR